MNNTKITKKIVNQLAVGALVLTQVTNVYGSINKKDITYNGKTYTYSASQGDLIQYKDRQGNSLFVTKDPNDSGFDKYNNYIHYSDIAKQLQTRNRGEYDIFDIKTSNTDKNSIIDGTYDNYTTNDVLEKFNNLVSKEKITSKEVMDFINLSNESLSRITGSSLNGTIVTNDYYKKYATKQKEHIILITEDQALKMQTSIQARMDLIEKMVRQQMDLFMKEDIVFNKKHTTSQLFNLAADKSGYDNQSELIQDVAAATVLELLDPREKEKTNHKNDRNQAVYDYNIGMKDLANYIKNNSSLNNLRLKDGDYKKSINFAADVAPNNVQNNILLVKDYATNETYLENHKNATETNSKFIDNVYKTDKIKTADQAKLIIQGTLTTGRSVSSDRKKLILY